MHGITYIDYYIPGEELLIGDFLEAIAVQSIPSSFKNKEEYKMFLENILKLKSIRIETKQDEVSMIGGLVEKLFDSAKVKPEDIDIIISTQERLQGPQPNMGKFIQYKYKMGNSYVIAVMGNHCANIETSIYLANSILHTYPSVKNIMVLTSEKMETNDQRVYGTYAVVGDAAGIILLSRDTPPDEKYPIILRDCVSISNAKLYNASVNDDNMIAHCFSYIKCLSELINKNSITDNHIEKILIQNANPLMVTQCIASAGLNKNKIFTKNQGKYGHLNYVDFPINLKDIVDEGIVAKDKYILTFGLGTLGSYVSCLLSFK